jgi:L-alanine-DL-glutamate epimerase-like enolase superfamily enzyme
MTLTTGLSWEKLVLKLVNPFRLSYGVSETRHAYWLRLPEDEGWGEGTIPPYYGIPEADMENYWRAVAASSRPLPEDSAEIEAWPGIAGPAPARCALDLALYDRLARQRSLPLYAFLGLPEPASMPTSFTIAIDTPEAMARLALENQHFPIIKVKLGSEDDEARLKAIRQARPDARLRVDANAGWDFEEALRQVEKLQRYELEMIEQPLPKEQIEAMGELQKQVDLPLVADESVQTLADVERLADAGVRGINLKLMKVGGLTPALRMLSRARQLGLQVMLGCMVETSLGTTAMAHLAGMADWLDLDAPLLISNDPFSGVTYSPSLELSVPQRPGIGVMLKESWVN